MPAASDLASRNDSWHGDRVLMKRLLLTVLVLWGALVQPARAADDTDATGWHGEVLPPGMSRSQVAGEYVWSRDGATMVYVPAGAFRMGDDDGAHDERPAHTVLLDSYYIDKYEVSWGQWLQSKLPYADKPVRDSYPEVPSWGLHEDQPVVSVTWHWARRYADWAGKRLPTEAEWEKAARGTDGRKYPWGDDPPNFDRAIWRYHPTAEEATAPVDCCAAGASPYGVLNMAGNVYEWCQDLYDRDYYARSPASNPVNEDSGTNRVLRGGAHVLEVSDLTTTLRYRLLPSDRAPYIGLRTVVSGVGPGPKE